MVARLPAEGDAMPLPRLRPEVLAFLATRRSTKVIHLIEPGPSPAQVDALLALASRVPDHGKLGPFRFVVLEGEARARFGEANAAALLAHDALTPEAALEAERTRYLRAPVTVAVVSTAAEHPKIPVWEQELVAGEVCFALLLAAHASGWGACWLTGPNAYDAAPRAWLGVTGSERIAGFISLGTPTQAQPERARPPVRIARPG
jgi:nitroreductase